MKMKYVRIGTKGRTMNKDLYRIEYFDGKWTVRGEDGWGTYYFGDSCEDCEEWVSEHHGELTEIIKW